MVAESKRLTLCQGFSNFLQDVANFANFHRECCKFQFNSQDWMMGYQGLVNVPFLGYWTPPFNGHYRWYTSWLGDVQLGRLMTHEKGRMPFFWRTKTMVLLNFFVTIRGNLQVVSSFCKYHVETMSKPWVSPCLIKKNPWVWQQYRLLTSIDQQHCWHFFAFTCPILVGEHNVGWWLI